MESTAEFTLDIRPRTSSGTRAASALRAEGLVPAVIYGRGEPVVHISVSLASLTHAFAHNMRVFDVEMDGKESRLLLQEVAYDALGDEIQHVDFLRAVKGETLQFTVPIEFVGHAKGTMEIQHLLMELEVECRASLLPDSVPVVVTEMEEDTQITVADLVLPEGVVSLVEADTPVCSARARAEEVEDAEPELEEGAEPEVIGEVVDTDEDEESPDQAGEAG